MQGERAAESALRPTSLAEFEGQPRVSDQLGLVLEAARHRGAHGRPRAAVRAARAGQDHARDDHRGRDVGAAPDLQRPGHPARRRSRRDPVRAGRGRSALPRRDPPDVASRRGDAVPGDGGLPRRHHGRQGAGATAIPIEIPPFTLVGATTRAGPAARPAARPVRLHRPAGLLRRRPRSNTSSPAPPACSVPELRPEGARRDRPPIPRHAADRQSAAAPGPRLRPGAGRRGHHP